MRKRLLFLCAFLCCACCAVAKSSPDQEVLKVSILGDSYSTFEGAVVPSSNAVWYFEESDAARTDVNNVEQTWWRLLCDYPQYKLERNNSFSGSTICNTGYKGQDATATSFITRASNLGDPDVILIFGATNDSWANVPIGEFSYGDWSAKELFSFRPATAYLLDTLNRLYPDAEILFMINDNLKEEIDSSVITICDHYNVDYIELREIDKLTGHPSVKGMEQICEQLISSDNL